MAQRNRELHGEHEEDEDQGEDLDCLDPEEETAMLGKRFKATIGLASDNDRPKKVYQVARPPQEEPIKNRDEDDDTNDQEEVETLHSYEASQAEKSITSGQDSQESDLSKRAVDRQRAMGY